MKIIFGLGWEQNKVKNHLKAFKDSSAADLFEKYRVRISHDFPCEAMPMSFDNLKKQTGLIWICERAQIKNKQKSRMLSSEELAVCFQKVCDSGTKSLTVWIGGPDGLTPEQLNSIQTDLLWSFGPLTLPHELASVVAAEQLYRAVSILKNHPYHSGH